MNKLFLPVLMLIFWSCSKDNKVYLVKQWHLSPNQSTTDIAKAKNLAQFSSQRDTYLKVKKLVKQHSGVVIAEGCEKEMTDSFSKKFNGWSLEDLKMRRDLSDFEDILAPVPMKIKAKFGKEINVVCGDNDELTKKNNLAYSDTKAFSAFFQRLFYYRSRDPEKYNKYLKAFENTVDIKEGDDPVQIAKEKALTSLSKFKYLIETRNLHFVKAILNNIEKNPVVVVGGLHVAGIAKELKKAGVNYEVITPIDYPKEELELFKKLESTLNHYKGKPEVVFYQVPEGFDPKLWTFKNLLPKVKLASGPQWKTMEKICHDYDIDTRFLRSDYDGDGIRDFTLSESPQKIILTAEDRDWDQDGIINLLDPSIGKDELFKIQKAQKPFTNTFKVKNIKNNKIAKYFKDQNIALLENNGQKHDIFILEIIRQVSEIMNYPQDKLKVIRATEPAFTYGKKVFFSYVPSSLVMEIYPKRLFEYLRYKKENDFKGSKTKDFFNGYVTPLVIHSVAHELGHTINFKIHEFAKKNGWEWKEIDIDSLYLKNFRLKDKIIKKEYQNYSYVGLTYSEWLKEHKLYLNTVNKYLNKYPDREEFNKKVKELKWYTYTDSKKKEFQLSFLVNRKIPSLYSLSEPKEWVAELMSSCVFQHFYPKSSLIEEAIRYELTIGFNPRIPPEDFCRPLLK